MSGAFVRWAVAVVAAPEVAGHSLMLSLGVRAYAFEMEDPYLFETPVSGAPKRNDGHAEPCYHHVSLISRRDHPALYAVSAVPALPPPLTLLRSRYKH